MPVSNILNLIDRQPRVSGAQLVANLTPPAQFHTATFESYRPDPQHPSQEEARSLLRNFVAGTAGGGTGGGSKGGFFGFGRKKKAVDPEPAATSMTVPAGKMGVYLDGGFGVGKTHLLAAAWHAQAGRKYFGTFIEYTALVGALGYEGAIKQLTGAKLICIDEFELDDPGDTMLMTRMIKDLTATGSKFIATSNTPPNALGEGRFAAADFMREIQAMSDRFVTVRIDGADYRQRNIEGAARVLSPEEYQQQLSSFSAAGTATANDDFGSLLEHLKQVHPSSYAAMLEGVERIGLSDVYELHDQSQALRFVAFIDRVYDAQIPIFASGIPLNEIFGGGMLDGGYRKKYLRCMSRANALCAANETADAVL
ncbi:cell division protein ZapE [Canibacter oris]|uniref:Cell division protein ZapE n=1 Tax=Canibacter oris TaxID=1365628 RepID=A0A840DEP1_9MICO|nr:cell division protein ZapE [Canibacter oris]